MPDSNRPSLFTRPEEPPLGYEAIRAWLRKPRPLLRSALSWIPLFLSKLYDAGVFIRRNARPGAEWVQRAAKKAEPVVRAGDTTQRYGERITAGSEIAGAVLSVLETVTGLFKPLDPISIDSRVVKKSPEPAEEAPEPDGRFLPCQPDKRPLHPPADGRSGFPTRRSPVPIRIQAAR